LGPKELNQKGTVSVYLNQYGKVMIRYRADGWANFLNTFVPYFTMLYGQKFMALNIFKKVFELTSSNLIADQIFIVHLIYSLQTSVVGRKLSLEEKLDLLNLNYETKVPNLSVYKLDNPQDISLFFLIGFFIGDGNLGLWPVWSESNTRIIFNPRLTLVQLAKESNINLMKKILAARQR